MDRMTNRRSSGTAYTMGLWGELHEGATLSCSHCQFTWVLAKGSGKSRGFCQQCMGYTCGAHACMECVPAELRMENLEAGRPELTPAPAMISVPAGVDFGEG